jgi:flagellar biosynthesis protein FliR
VSGVYQILENLTGLGQTWLWAATLVFLRVGSVMALMPAFGDRTVPTRVRLALTLAFTAIVAPSVADDLSRQPFSALPAAVEVMVGLALGIGLRLFLFALEVSASIIANATSLAQLFGGSTPEPQPAIGHVLTMAGLALAVLSGLHVKAAALIILSYRLLPAGAFPAAQDMAQWGLAQIVQFFALAFTLAAPFLIASVLYNVALGIINRAMPQLAVTLVGAPLLSWAALTLMMVIVPLILSVWWGRFDTFLALPFRSAP